MQKNLRESIIVLESCKAILISEFNIEAVAIFGSMARRQNHRNSDIDILVRFSKLPSFFELARIEKFLQSKLQIRIDLVIENDAEKVFIDRISRDIIAV